MEERSTFSISVGEILYYCMFGILLFSKAIGWYDGMTQFKAVLVISAALFACKLLVTRQTWRDWLFVLSVCALSAASYYFSGEKSLILYAFMALGMKDVPVRRVMKWAMAVWSVGFIGLTALCAFGVLSEKILVHPKHFFGYVICHSFGYAHPNVLHVSYVVFAALILYLVDQTRSRRLLWVSTVLLFIGNIIVFISSISFTGVAIAMFLLVINLYLQLRGTVSRAESVLVQCIMPACVIFSLVGPKVLYYGRLFELINKALNTRYYLTYYYLTEQPTTLMGLRMTVPDYHYTIDCSYTYLLVQLGVIPFVIVMLGIFLLIRDAMKEHRYAEAAMVVSFCVGGISEPFLFNTSFKNLTFVFLGAYVYRKLAAGGAEGRCLVSMETPERWRILLENIVDDVHGIVQNMMFAVERYAVWVPSMFAVVTVVLTAVLFCVNPWAQSIYVPDAWHDDKELETVALTDADVEQILSNHGEIIGQASQYDEMVSCKEDTILVENVCKSVNAGAAVGTLVMVAYVSRRCRHE